MTEETLKNTVDNLKQKENKTAYKKKDELEKNNEPKSDAVVLQESKDGSLYEQEMKKAGQADDDYDIDIVRDYHGAVDVFHLSNKDPNYQYRFIRDDQKNIRQKTSNLLEFKGGWQIVPRKHLVEVMKMPDRDISPDGVCRRGDTILCRMPKELFKEKEAAKLKKANAPMDAIDRMLKEGDPNVGGTSMHPSMKGIQTGDKMRMG